MSYATKYYLEKSKNAASQPAGWLTAFEQSHFFFAKKNDTNIKLFGAWIKKKAAIVKTGASFLPRDLFPDLTVTPYV